MELKDKKLLYKDLCSRLPYHPIVEIANDDWEGCKQGVFNNIMGFHHLEAFLYDRIELVPYLRPMSSMTEKERGEFSIFTGKTEVFVQQVRLDADSMINPIIGGFKCVYWCHFDKCIDWLNEHHFDYRNLIEKGLALEATEGMYK